MRLALAFLLAALAACTRAAVDSPGSGILVVVLDACRADKIGAYGQERPVTPVLDALAADPDAVVFRRHYVQGTWTKPSSASLFTGRWVHEHGVVTGRQDEGGEESRYATQVLSEGFDTLAERFAAGKYTTFAVVKSYHLAPEFGFDQGFAGYDLDRKASDRRRIESVLERVAASPREFFGYTHLSACHNPFPKKDRDPEYVERFGFDYDEAARRAAGVDFSRAGIKYDLRDGRLTLEPADVRFLNLVYEAKLRKVDGGVVGPLIEGLKKLGRYDDTLLVVTADHGEALWDHPGTYAHNGVLWDENVRVPLIVKFPRGRKPAALGKSVDALTRAIDLYPALLAWSGLEAPGDLPGKRIFAAELAAFALTEDEDGFALVEGATKMIRTADKTMLFDLAADPGERTDLAPADLERLATLQERAGVLRGTDGPGLEGGAVVEKSLDQDTLEELRSLGYIQ